MENEILKLIHKYKQMKRTEPYDNTITLDFVIADLKSLAETAANTAGRDKSLIISFVQGAKWWEYRSTKFTMWQSDVILAEEEAIRRSKGGTLGKTINRRMNGEKTALHTEK